MSTEVVMNVVLLQDTPPYQNH